MCRAAPSAHGSPPTKNRRSRKNRRIARKSLHRSAGAPPFNVQHTRTDREEDPATRAVRRPRATPLSLSQPFSPGRRRCSGAGPAPRSAPTATVPLLRRDVHFALENDGWNCTFECEVHVSASSGARRGAPLWQISTRPRPEPSHQPHQPHHAPAHPRHYNDPSPRTVAPGRLFGGRWCGGGTRTVARGEEGSLPPGNARRRSPNNLPRRNSPQVQSTPLIPPFPGCGSRRERSTCRIRLTPPAPGARIPDPRAPG